MHTLGAMKRELHTIPNSFAIFAFSFLLVPISGMVRIQKLVNLKASNTLALDGSEKKVPCDGPYY
jgi:hypothetical protein